VTATVTYTLVTYKMGNQVKSMQIAEYITGY
jgi:hypothetical protein